METMSSLKGKVNNFTGAISNVNAAFQNSNVGTFNYGKHNLPILTSCLLIVSGVGGEQMSDKLDACIAALGQTDPEYDRNLLITYKDKPTEGTYQWILDNGVFQSWKSEEDSEQPLIWVCDEPGVGKTTLAIFISEYLEESNLNTDDSWVLYYFCDRQDENRNTAASILKGFMLQLYKKHQGLATIIYNEYKIQRDALFQPHSIEPLWKIFEAMVKASPVKRIFCVIDGIDQCEELKLDHFLKKLNKHFTEHAHRQARNKAESSEMETERSEHSSKSQPAEFTEMRMIILCRENPKCIVQELRQFPRLLLGNGGTRTAASDLRRFIDVKVERVSTSCAGDKTPSRETTQVISQVLDQGIDRSFLWVTLMAEKLTSMKQSQVKKYAKRLPESVEEIHIQNLLEIPPRQRAQVSAIMKWVTSAVRPVSTLELTKAVKYLLKTSFTKKALKKALILCRGLVQVQGKQVILTDQSVRELLFREQSPLREYKELKDFVFERSDIHSELANTCVAYLQESANLEKSRRVRLKPGDKLKQEDATFLRKHPFLEYAIAHWTFHAKQGNTEKTNYSVSFFKDDSQRRRLWWESYWISLRQTFAWKWTAPGRFSLLHLAAFFDIVPLAVHVERKGRLEELLGAEDHQGMKPINWATERSQAAMVKFLLQKGEFDNEALRQAARTGEASIITMLLENRETMLRSPRLASSKSSPSLSPNPFQSFRKVTLNSIADLSKKIDKTPDDNSTPVSPEFKGYGKATSESPLHIAATCGHEEAIEAFLKAGEDFTRTTDGGWTPLHNAAWFGRVSIVNILLAAGADASTGTKEQLTPLHCAVKNSQPEVVECLLNKRMLDIEVEDQFGLTPFHMACKANDIRIMEILLDYGASIERSMRQGWTPLIWACINGQLAVAQVLLKRGADVNAKWVHISSESGKAIELGAIGLAKAYRHEEIARLLEKCGASDTKPLSLGEAKILPPAGALEESYDLPQIQDIHVIDQDGMATGGTSDADDSESLAESDDESDDGGDISDEAGRSRNQFASDFPKADIIRRQSSPHPFGLGIQEDPNSDTANHSVQHGTSSLALASAHAAEGHVTTTTQHTTDPDIIDQPEDKARSESLM